MTELLKAGERTWEDSRIYTVNLKTMHGIQNSVTTY